jgi:hypothetical protein
MGAGSSPNSGGGGGAAYAFAGSDFNTGSVGNVWTSTASNIGPATAGRLVIVLLACQNNPTLTMTVNGVSMTRAGVSTANAQASIWYGTVATGSGTATIVVTGGNFLLETMLVYYATGLGSNTPVSVSAAGGVGTWPTISVNSGDFLFGFYSGTGTANWSASTVSPSGTQSQTGSGGIEEGFSADWTIASTNASFTVNTSGVSNASAITANWR